MYQNADKTEFTSFNQEQETVLKSVDNKDIKKVDNFKYLGALIGNNKALGWKSCNKLNNVWQPSLSKSLTLSIFLALVKSGFLYGSESWTLAKGLEKDLDGTYTRFLRMDFNVSWSEHLTNSELYSNLSKVSLKIGPRKLKLSGNCVRHPEEIAFAIRLYFMANIKRMTK